MNEEETGERELQKRVSWFSEFIETTQYQQFVELCESCRQAPYMGLCTGDAGVGKTRSAWHYTHWEQMNHLLVGEQVEVVNSEQFKLAFYTPGVLISAKRFEQEVLHLHARMKMLVSLTPPVAAQQGYPRKGYEVTPLEWDLLVIDEADRLKTQQLEVLRDLFDRSPTGVLLIGMSGLGKRLTRYPQFFSRVGFKHDFCVLPPQDLKEVFNRQWRLMHPEAKESVAAWEALDEDALAAIIRITHGNFRDEVRLLLQVERILRVNRLSKVTKAVVETARMSLLFGPEGKP